MRRPLWGAAALWLGASGCAPSPRILSPADVAAPLEYAAPRGAATLNTQRGFGTLEAGNGDDDVRALVLRFVSVLADENVSQLRELLGQATWQPGVAQKAPADELARRFALLDFQSLRAPIAQGVFERMQVRSVDATSWDVRLPFLSGPEPLFLGRPVLRVVRAGDALSITSYGEE